MTTFEKIIDLNIELEVFSLKKIIDLDFEIDSNYGNMKIDLIEVLLQFDKMKFKI